MSSVLVSLYTVTKVISQIWVPPFCPGSPVRGLRGALPPALVEPAELSEIAKIHKVFRVFPGLLQQ